MSAVPWIKSTGAVAWAACSVAEARRTHAGSAERGPRSSAVTRRDAHRFYLANGLAQDALLFGRVLR